MYVGLFVPRFTINFNRLGVNVTNAAAGSTCQAVIYSDDNGTPGTLLYASGALSSATTGAPMATVSGTLLAGVPYWCGVHALGGNPSVRASSLGNTINVGGSGTTSTGNSNTGTISRSGQASPPNPFGARSYLTNFAPPLARIRAS